MGEESVNRDTVEALKGVIVSFAKRYGERRQFRPIVTKDNYRAREKDLSFVNLSRIDISGTNLRRVILREADLRGADLYGADLRAADLYGAPLHEANLYGAGMRGVKNFTQDQLNRVCVNHKTALPEGLTIGAIPQSHLEKCAELWR